MWRNPDGVWIIQNGWVDLLPAGARTNGVIALLGPLQCVGDIPLMLDVPAAYRARMVGETDCLFIASDRFKKLLLTNFKLTWRWSMKLAGHVERFQGRVFEMLGSTLRQRVARVLVNLWRAAGPRFLFQGGGRKE